MAEQQQRGEELRAQLGRKEEELQAALARCAVGMGDSGDLARCAVHGPQGTARQREGHRGETPPARTRPSPAEPQCPLL